MFSEYTRLADFISACVFTKEKKKKYSYIFSLFFQINFTEIQWHMFVTKVTHKQFYTPITMFLHIQGYN